MATLLRTMLPKAAYAGFIALTINISAYSAPLDLQDVPLFLSASVNPNVLINMSVETPMGGAAYTDQSGVPSGCGGRRTIGGNGDVGTCYFPTNSYLGYFDPDKCYTYDTGAKQFNPAAATGSNHTCTAQWSGNFLNWVSMTAVDMFVLNMTGGNRVVDSTTQTVVKRARKQNNDSWFPIKALDSIATVAPSTVTPFTDTILYFYNTSWGLDVGTTYKGTDKGQFDINVRVCDSTISLEKNCTAYGSSPTYYKPEGLIQKNNKSKRFGVLSYLNDNSKSRDGGVLRSKMKYVGPKLPDGTDNTLKEFGTDGLLVNNPNGAGGGLNSGVINYINKFSEAGYKSYDPISELYYEGIRYFKHLGGPTPEYVQNLSGTYGGFQVITNWDDPIQYRCQKNFTVAINDANPWLDKKLPGTSFTTATVTGAAGASYTLDSADYGAPTNPDTDINVTTLTNRVGELEGLNGTTWSQNGTWQVTSSTGTVTATGQNDSVGGGAGTFDNGVSDKVVAHLGEVMGTAPYAPKQNSYYIAGLAYYANTQDLRSDLANDRGKQTVQSFVIDTQEYSTNPLDGPKNMLWLAGKYGGFTDTNDDGIPQRDEWDEDDNGMPDNYVLATNPANLISGLNRAFAFIDKRSTSASSASVNSGSISTETRVYQAKFDSSTWTGQLLSFPIATDVSGKLNANGTLAAEEWDAASVMPTATNRVILTRKTDGTGAAFKWADLDNARKLQLDPSYVSDDTFGTALVNYLRGDASNEGTVGQKFRARTSRLGDIVSSAPIFVGEPRFSYRDSLETKKYSTFRLDNTDTDGTGPDTGRQPVVYAGANDGMLHAFDATSGKELMAYVPGTVYGNLRSLASPTYTHKFFVDGAPNMGDVFINGDWETVLIGGLNKGGQGIYALKITDPKNFTEAKASDVVMWEFTDRDPDGATNGIVGDADLGYTYSQPAIVRTNSLKKWAAVFGNGYNNTASDGAASTTGNAVLYVVDIATGKLIAKLDTGVGSAADPTALGRPNGLSTPAAVDLNGDAIVDYVYAGDLFGNLWKFDLRDADSTKWTIANGTTATPKPLFSAVKTVASQSVYQSITSRPEVIRGPNGVGMMVLFGTGKYLEPGDKTVNAAATPLEVQSYYGVHDRNTHNDSTELVAGRSELVEQTIIAEQSVTFGTNQYDVRATSSNAAGQKGWYMDLLSPKGFNGERQVSNSVVRAGRVIFTTLIPDVDPCNFGGKSWLMELDALTGARLTASPFDLDRDNQFGEGDYITVSINGVDTKVPVSGLRPDVGITPEPGVLIGEGGTKEFKYNPGTTGTISVTVENPGEGAAGRQSWRQAR